MIITPLKIQGKKTKLIPDIRMISENILKSNPDIDTWVEPFLGSGVVAFNCVNNQQIKKVIVNDINPHIIDFYQAINDGKITGDVLREKFEDFSGHLKEEGETFYLKIRERFNLDFSPIDFLFLTRTGFNGIMRFNSRGHWNVPFCKLNNRLSESVINELVDSTNELEKLFKSKKFEFYNTSFEKVIEPAPRSSIFYCDPPYFGLDVNYFSGWEEKDEIKLNQLLTDKRFIYSTWLDNGHKSNPMVERLWKKYNVLRKDHKYMVAKYAKERLGVIEGIFYTGSEIQERLTLW